MQLLLQVGAIAADNKHRWLCGFLVIGSNSGMYLRKKWYLKPLSWITLSKYSEFTYSLAFLRTKFPLFREEFFVHWEDGMEIHPDARGWEGGRERTASCLQTWFKWYTSDSISLAEAGDAFSSVYVTVLPKPFQNFRLWGSFFAATFTTFNSLCLRRNLSQLTLSPFAWNRMYRDGIEPLARLPQGAAVLVSWDLSTSSYSSPWELKQDMSKIKKLP